MQIELWLGSPDCQTAHNALLAELVRLKSNFINAAANPTNIQRGSLGEFIALRIAQTALPNISQTFAPNAINPLNSASISGIDLTYLLFHESDENLDLVFIQEVKTTIGSSLSYGDALISDYEKLFGTNLNFTLQSRLQAISNSLEIERNLPDLVDRVNRLAGVTPQTCNNVRLYPTLVHEREDTAPVAKMVAIRQAISSIGWPASSINAWAIALTDLDDRLKRLSRGQP